MDICVQRKGKKVQRSSLSGSDEKEAGKSVVHSESLPELSDPELESDEWSLSFSRRAGGREAVPRGSKRAIRSSS